MYCTNCGKENEEGTSFCTDCGKQFDRAAFVEVSAQMPVSDIPSLPEPIPPPIFMIPEIPTLPDIPSPQIIAPPPLVDGLYVPPASPHGLQPQPPPYTQGAYYAPPPVYTPGQYPPPPVYTSGQYPPPPMYTSGQYPPPPGVKKLNKAIIIAIIIAAVALIGFGIGVYLFVNHLTTLYAEINEQTVIVAPRNEIPGLPPTPPPPPTPILPVLPELPELTLPPPSRTPPPPPPGMSINAEELLGMWVLDYGDWIWFFGRSEFIAFYDDEYFGYEVYQSEDGEWGAWELETDGTLTVIGEISGTRIFTVFIVRDRLTIIDEDGDSIFYTR